MTEDYIPGGYVLIAKKIRKSALWKSLKVTHRIVMLEILLQAQWQDGEVAFNGETLFLKRGQFATSYQNLVDDIGDKTVKVKVVRNAIKKLVSAGFVAKDEAKARAKKGLLLTVIKYDYYQDFTNYTGKAKGKEKGITGAKRGQSEGNERAITKEDNTVKDNKEEILSVFTHWNAKKIIRHRELTKALSSSINARLEKYSAELILDAIDNYATVLHGDEYFFSYKWPLDEFVKPKNLDRFLAESKPLINFLKEKPKQSEHRPNVARALKLVEKYKGEGEPHE